MEGKEQVVQAGTIMGEIATEENIRPSMPAMAPTEATIGVENLALKAAAKQPAAVISARLTEMLIMERRGDDQLRRTGAEIRDDIGKAQVDNDGTLATTDIILESIEAQFQANKEVAVLAQANQLPNPALPFSSSTEA